MRGIIEAVTKKRKKNNTGDFFVIKMVDGTEGICNDDLTYAQGKMVDYQIEQKGSYKIFNLIGVVDMNGTAKAGGNGTRGKDAPLPGMVLSYAKDAYIALVNNGLIKADPVEIGDRVNVGAVLTPLSDIYDFMMLMSEHGSRKAVLDAYVEEWQKLQEEEVPF